MHTNENCVRAMLRGANVFCRKIAFAQLSEYVNSICTSGTHWVLQYECEYVLPLISETCTSVVFVQLGPSDQLLLKILQKRGIHIYILNTEQLSRLNCTVDGDLNFVPFPFEHFILRFVRNDQVSLLDYSCANIAIWNSIFPKTQVGLVTFRPSLSKEEEADSPPSLSKTPTIDLDVPDEKKPCVFVGDINSSYRQTILASLCGDVDVVHNLFGLHRDLFVFKHRFLINIHFGQSYKVFEELRCLPCVLQKMIVISEKSLFDKKHPLYPFILFCPYRKLVACTRKAIQTYEVLYSKLFINNPKFNSLTEDIVAYENDRNTAIYFEQNKNATSITTTTTMTK